LKWPPEMCPTAEAITAIASPWASPIAVRLPPAVAMIEPTPTKMSVKVPTNSAVPSWLERPRDGVRTLLRGMAPKGCEADVFLGVILRNERRQPMSASDLKRKLRNFPAANLNQRISA
jgi:hypothetical protein